MRRITTIVAAAAILITVSGCTVVKPWERDLLARRDMAFESDTLEAAREAHIYFSKEASMPGGSGGGGGCGCN
jgi:hypothetical protein